MEILLSLSGQPAYLTTLMPRTLSLVSQTPRAGVGHRACLEEHLCTHCQGSKRALLARLSSVTAGTQESSLHTAPGPCGLVHFALARAPSGCSHLVTLELQHSKLNGQMVTAGTWDSDQVLEPSS